MKNSKCKEVAIEIQKSFQNLGHYSGISDAGVDAITIALEKFKADILKEVVDIQRNGSKNNI